MIPGLTGMWYQKVPHYIGGTATNHWCLNGYEMSHSTTLRAGMDHDRSPICPSDPLEN